MGRDMCQAGTSVRQLLSSVHIQTANKPGGKMCRGGPEKEAAAVRQAASQEARRKGRDQARTLQQPQARTAPNECCKPQ